MEFWAIAYQYQEDIFFNFKTKEEDHVLDSTCLLPTKELSEQFIEENLCSDYVPVKINLKTLQENGIWSYERDTVERWDWQED